MAWNVSPDPLRPEAAISWFARRLALSDADLKAIREEARRRAFWVSGLAALDMVQEVYEAVARALDEGLPFAEFQRAISERVKAAWGEGARHRLATVFRTNLQMAYGAGRWKQAQATVHLRPYWGLQVVLDGRTSHVCRPLAGLVLPADHPFWATHIPPLHHGCRTALVTYTREEGERLAWQNPPEHAPQEGFGRAPSESEWSPNPRDYHPELWRAYIRGLGRAYPEADAHLRDLFRRREKPAATDWMLALGRVAVARFPQDHQDRVPERLVPILGPRASRRRLKWLVHVQEEQQFQATEEEYERLLQEVATHPDVAVLLQAVSGREHQPVLLVLAPMEAVPEAFRGPGMGRWVVVVYDLLHGALVTGYTASRSAEVTLWPNRIFLRTRSPWR